jgi:LuxR family transcriptional regulator, maltose regulon positive regulatory protein
LAGADRSLHDAWALLPGDEAAARDAGGRALAAALARGDGPATALAAAALITAVAIEYADFRGLARWLELLVRHDPGPGGSGQLDPATDALLDFARMSLPLLDGNQPFDTASDAAAERTHRLLGAPDWSPDARMLALKLLLDYRGQQLELARIEPLIALGHEWAARAGVSPAWRGRWWLLVLQNREWFGDQAATAQALQQAQQLVQRHGLPRLRFELACVEMSAALKADDLPQAERLFREIDALRPAVRPGRLPHGLRAQALYLARRGELAAALQRLDLLLALCAEMEVPRRDVGPYQVLRADCLLGLGRHDEALALLEAQCPDQQGPQGALFAARIAVHRAASCLDNTGAAADALCRQALEACAALRYSRFLRPLPGLAARLVERGMRLGAVPEFLSAVVHERRLVPADPWREDWPWRLRVRILGPLQVERDGLPLAGPAAKAQRKPLELLRLLAAHGGGPLAVSVVIDQLWPSLDADAPRASFEMAVSRLRKLLGLPEAVRVADDAISLDRALVWVDAAAFEGLAQGDDTPSTPTAARALALYRAPLLGPEALSGLLHAARERLALIHATLAQAECERLLQQGQVAVALRRLHTAVAHDPLNEPLHRTLMRAYLQQGEHAEALRAYHRLSELLARHLNVSPSAQTLALAREAQPG